MSRDKKQEAILRKVLRRIAPHWMLLAGTLLLAWPVWPASSMPIFGGPGRDCILGPGQVVFETLGAILLWIGLTAAAGALAQWCMGELNNRITFQVVRDLREGGASGTSRELPLRYLDSASPRRDGEPDRCRRGSVLPTAFLWALPSVYRPHDHWRDAAVYAAHSLENCAGGHFSLRRCPCLWPNLWRSGLTPCSASSPDPGPSDGPHRRDHQGS